MAAGFKTGGRVAGTPNRRTADLAQRLDALGVDPVLGLAEIAKDETAPADLRARVNIELMSYLFPKRKALDVSTGTQRPISIRIGIPGRDAVEQPDEPVEGRDE